MGIPQFPDISQPAPQGEIIDRLLETVALEELALAALINAEAEHLQAVAAAGVAGPIDACDLSRVNLSVSRVIEAAALKEDQLRRKMAIILSHKRKPFEPQFARPASDVTINQWMICPGCVGPLFAQINEVVPDDTDFIQTVPNPVNAIYETHLSPVSDPQTNTGHFLRYRFQKIGAVARIINLTVELRQGATVIATFAHLDIPLAITQANQELTPAQAALITDYTDLRIRFIADTASGIMAARAAVTWAEFEVPDP